MPDQAGFTKSNKIDIVMFNMSAYSEWQQGYVNRNSHILHELLRDPRVRKIVAVDYLPFTWKRAAKIWLQDVMHWPRGKKMSGNFVSRLTAVNNGEINKTIYQVEGDTEAVDYKLFVYSTVLSWYSEIAAMTDLIKRLKKINLKNVVAWSFVPTFTKYFDLLNSNVKVFDAVDNWLEHSSYERIWDQLKLNYQTIRYKADIIFTTSREMVKYLERQQDTYYVPNGIRLQHWQELSKLIGRDIAAIPRPIIGYVGIIQEDRIDLDLIAYLAKNNPKKSFVFVGPIWSSFKKQVASKLASCSNLYWLGHKHHSEVPSYVNQFDVAIVPHLVNEFGKHTSLLKVLEYLVLGKAVVATPTAGTEIFKDVISLARKPEEFNQSILKALIGDSEAKQQKRKQAAAQHTWQKRVQFMLDKVMEKISP
ncbi:MAG: glycosyltransferase [Patescibacteria group bacterium]